MTAGKLTYGKGSAPKGPVVREGDIETSFISRLDALKYSRRSDITDRAAIEMNSNARHLATDVPALAA